MLKAMFTWTVVAFATVALIVLFVAYPWAILIPLTGMVIIGAIKSE